MLFGSGNPNLRTRTRFLAGDPSTAPNPLFSQQEVDDAINIEYFVLADLMRHLGEGFETVRAYANSVADQLHYEKPGVGTHAAAMHILSVEVELDGKDLRDDTTAVPTFLEPRAEEFAMQAWEEGEGVTAVKYYFQHNQHFGIVAPLGVSGTRSIRVTYSRAPQAMALTTDSPEIIPPAYHDLICHKAAISLLTSKHLPIDQLQFAADRLEIRFLRAAHDTTSDDEQVIPVAGKVVRNSPVKQGRILRR